MAFAFEKLLVYQKSVDFADQVCDLVEQFPARYNHLADPLIASPRSAWLVVAAIGYLMLSYETHKVRWGTCSNAAG